MKLIIVRHGETEENKNHIWQGQSEGMLNEKGEEQSRRLVKRLKKENIDMIYCSDLRRARNTIKPFLEEKNIPIQYAKELRERKLGVLEGLTTEEVEKYLEKNKTDSASSDFETGETYYDVLGRVTKFYKEVVEKHKNDTILFVTHGGPISQIILYLFDYPKSKFKEYVPNNASITEIEIKEEKPRLLIFNDIGHLDSF